MSDSRPTIAVLGAINVDLVVRVPSLPAPGETVTGGTFSRHQGGKGGNQAVAAARALESHGEVVMLGCVGDDDLGREAVAALRHDGIDVSGVAVAEDAHTGVALIVVDEAGENQIAVAPGANLHLPADGVIGSLERIRPTWLLMSLEAAPEATRAAAAWAKYNRVPLLLNPAPPQPWARELLEAATCVTPNEHEREMLGPLPQTLTVVETKGAAGASVQAPATTELHLAGSPVEVVDTTGAGDCFNGVLAVGLAEGRSLREAVMRAIAAAARSVGVPGAREGMPTRAAIDAAMA